ncbi:MAG: TonB-dependent receptor domain-containing protein [bacterium]
MRSEWFILEKRNQRLLAMMVLGLAFLKTPDFSVSADETGCISGQVRNAKTRRGLADVNVLIKGQRAGTATLRGGDFIICELAPGSYVVQFSAVGYQNVQLTNVVVNSGDTTALNIALAQEVIPLDDILVIGVSKKLQRITEAPAAVSKLTPLHVHQFATTSQIPALFALEPGVDVVQNGIHDFNINARGFNSPLNRRVLVLLDNRETAMALLLAQEWNSYSFPLDGLGELEFVRGPGAALYGANAFSGVLNIRTPPPEQITGTQVTVAMGELNTVLGDFRHAGFHEPWGYKFHVGATRSETWSQSRNLPQEELDKKAYPGLPTEFIPLDDGDLSRVYASGRVDYNFSRGSVLTAEAGVTQAEDQVFVTGIGRIQVDEVVRPWARLNYTSEHAFFQADYNGRKTLSGHQRALNSVMRFRENSHDLNFQFQNNFSLLNEQLRIIWGASHRFQHVDTERTFTPETYDENQSGLFAQLEVNLSKKVALVAAGRLDRSTLHETQISPKAALVFSPTPQHTLRLTFNRAFQTPNYAEFFIRAPAGPPVDLAVLEQDIELAIELAENRPRGSVDLPLEFGLTPRLALGNRNLEVEKITGVEIGYKGVPARKWFFTVDVYLNRLTDFVTDLLPGVNPDFPAYELPAGLPDSWRQIAEQMIAERLEPGFSTLPDGSQAFVTSYSNAGRVDEWGVEIGLSHRFSDELSLRGNYTYFDFDIQDKAAGDRLLPNTPRHKVNLEVSYQKPSGLDLSVALKYVDEFTWAAGIFHGRVPSYAVVNLAAGYEIATKTRLGIAVTNLLNNRHYELFGGSVNGRRAMGSVRFQF